MNPGPEPPTAEPPTDQFTLEEWIEATQSCCGVDHPDDDSDPVRQP